MRIKIVHATIAAPVGEGARAVEVGEVLVVDDRQGRELVTLRRAVPWPVEAQAQAAVLPAGEEAMLRPVQPGQVAKLGKRGE